ncbi:MAG: CPBP family intramembrane glutamic endopeptidase, partial [Cyclobacteriaceae bacterium]
KSVGAIVIPALGFSLIHIQYSEVSTLTFIFIDGLYFGLARYYSKSVILAILLHAIGNTGALLERVL